MGNNNQTHPTRQRLVIVGGGTAGWMCAAALSRLVKHAGVSVMLVESDEIGTVGVGEATIPSIMTFNAMLGIDENDFLRQTQGTFKLGIQFVDWGALHERYIHPFGKTGLDFQGVGFHQYWLRATQLNGSSAGRFEDYSLSATAALRQKFKRPSTNPESVLSTLRYAFHFDAGLYARYLRTYAEQRGVLRLEGKVIEVHQHPHNGHIASLRLESGQCVDGDFFIDCSGFRALLIEGALGVGYEDWKTYLPCDRALAVPCESTGDPLPYTRSTADTAGWRWRIPLQSRIGNGYVYASDYLSDDEAKTRLMQTLEGNSLADPRPIRFRAGRRQTFWEKNCVAIGLAGGFLEPLESTSIHLIQTGIAKLMALFPGGEIMPAEVQEYNRQTLLEYEQVRDFIILHYKATRRDDSPFWRYCRDMVIPDSLAHKIELFRGRGRIFRREEELFTIDSWIAVMLGQNIQPQSYDPLVDALPAREVENFTRHVREMVSQTAETLPMHQVFIDANCKAPAVDNSTMLPG
jgi:tryptophan halogenase